MSGPATGDELLGLLEPGWRRRLTAGEPAGTLDVAPEVLSAVAAALGNLARSLPPQALSRRVPACVVVAVAQVTAHYDKNGTVWPAWHRAAGIRASRRSAADWAEAFLDSLAALGVPAATGDPRDTVLAHAAVPQVPALAHPGPGGASAARLDPFGRGVLARDAVADDGPADGGDWTALSPHEAVDPADPLLVFDTEGEQIVTVLPPEAVWLAHPADRSLHTDTALRILVESRLPPAWNGWRLVLVDLSPVAWLEVAATGGEAVRRHPVRGRARPRLVPGAPVPGISAVNGIAVFATPPALRLPAYGVHWHAEVRRLGSGQVLAAAEGSADRWDAGRLWDRIPGPLLGELVVTATARGGVPVPGLRRVVAVAEGLTVSYSPALRLPCEEGLETAEAVFFPVGGMTVAPCAAAIPAEVTGIDVACIAGDVVLPLRVTPPHWRARIEPEPGSGGTATAWHSFGPLRLGTPDLARGGALRLDLPTVAGDPPIEVVTGDEVVQVLEPFRRGGYPLRRVLDTVTAHGGAVLRITVGARTAVIARVGGPDAAADPWLPG